MFAYTNTQEQNKNPLFKKMERDFEAEGFDAGMSDATMGQSIWYFTANRFLNRFLEKHPEYAQFKNEKPMSIFSDRAEVFKELYSPEYIAHLEALEKLCKEFQEKHPVERDML
jgi:hypothetical protein